jgi:hypothetical protein
MIEACMRRGATYVHGILNSSSNPDIYSGEGDHPRARAHTFLEPQNPKERAQ